MEDEMEEMMGEGDEGFSSLQIDLDYEYSAPRFYDFVGMERADDSREAEAWFDDAGSDPDSPYLAKLLDMGEAIVDEENYLPQANDVEHCDSLHHLATDSRPSVGTDINMMDEDRKGNMQGTFLMEPSADFDMIKKSADVPVGYIQHLSQDTNLDCLVMDVADSLKEAEPSKGVLSNSHNGQDAPKGKNKALLTAPFSRTSTLMKPTASQLAKQRTSVLNFPREVEVFRRIAGRQLSTNGDCFPHVIGDLKNRSPIIFAYPFCYHQEQKDAEKASFNECHAWKRQKLDGGQLRKVQQLHDMKQLMPLLHKAPNKVQGQSNASCRGTHGAGLSNKLASTVKDRQHPVATREQAKLRLTVPREPELKTAQRARRIRPNTASNLDECELTKASLLKAQILKRKVLEAPSLPLPQRSARRMPVFHEFHLKTSERALQHSLAVPSTVSCTKPDNVRNMCTAPGRSDPTDTKPPHLGKHGSYPRSRVIDSTKTYMSEKYHVFKERPLDRKGFNFPTDKRFLQSNPPIELFNKLSLKSEVCHRNASQTTLPRASHLPLQINKGEKENVNNRLQQEHNMVMCTGKEKQNKSHMVGKQTKEGVGIAEISSEGQLFGRSPFTEMLEVNILSSRPCSNGSLLVSQNS